jgi:hypothetical protein
LECSACSGDVDESDQYCRHCGAEQESEPEAVGEQDGYCWSCDRCGAVVGEEDDFCKACGFHFSAPSAPTSRGATEGNAMALTGLVLGIASIFLSFIGVVPILAVVLSGIGLARASARDGAGRGQAWIGLLLGVVFTLTYLYQYGHLGQRRLTSASSRRLKASGASRMMLVRRG